MEFEPDEFFETKTFSMNYVNKENFKNNSLHWTKVKPKISQYSSSQKTNKKEAEFSRLTG